MENALKLIRDAAQLGRQAQRRGLYSLAAMRYAQVSALVQALVMLHEAGQITIPEDTMLAIQTVLETVMAAAETLLLKTGNGRKRLSGPESEVHMMLRLVVEESKGSMR